MIRPKRGALYPMAAAHKIMIIVAALVALAGQARAEVVTLVCNKSVEIARRVLEIDLANHTVTVTNKGSQPFHAQTDDRYVIWTDPFAEGLIENRLERATGHLDWRRPNRNMNWLSGGSCERASPVF